MFGALLCDGRVAHRRIVMEVAGGVVDIKVDRPTCVVGTTLVYTRMVARIVGHVSPA